MTRTLNPGDLRENEPLAPFTTLGVGGAARFFVEAESETQITEGLALAKAKGWPLFVLGGGSNIVVSDEGFPGLVIRVGLKGIRFDEMESGRLSSAAGEEWDVLVSRAVERNLAGIECLSGIPGTVGGTPIQNVGAYGQDVGETITAVRVLDKTDRNVRQIEAADCGFSYRSSIFNSVDKDRYIVLGVSFALKPGGRPCLRYADLQKRFAGNHAAPSLAEVRQTVLEIRAAKAMVIRPGDPDSRSAGSFFKNPLVTGEMLQCIEQRARQGGRLSAGEVLPAFEIPDGMYKLPAAWLIEKAGFRRGCNRGAVGLSSKHALAIVNQGGATARNVIDFMQEIQRGVQTAFGVDLIPEPGFIGF